MRRFGIEIEFVGADIHDIKEVLLSEGVRVTVEGYGTANEKDSWRLSPDSSVRQRGGELVSPPLEYSEESLATVARLADILQREGCFATKDCGLHVHVDVGDLEEPQILEIFKSYASLERHIDSMVSDSRRDSNNNYCRSIRTLRDSSASFETVRDISRLLANTGYGARYHKLNPEAFVKYGTVEFRQHQGTLNAHEIRSWVTFCVGFVENFSKIREKETYTVGRFFSEHFNAVSSMEMFREVEQILTLGHGKFYVDRYHAQSMVDHYNSELRALAGWSPCFSVVEHPDDDPTTDFPVYTIGNPVDREAAVKALSVKFDRRDAGVIMNRDALFAGSPSVRKFFERRMDLNH